MLNINDCKQRIDGILKEMPDRDQEVLSRRFGIGPNKKIVKSSTNGYETLESIGRDFGVTRERVRQIENKGLEEFKHSPYFADIQRFFLFLRDFIEEQGGLKRQDLLEKTLAPEEQLRPYLLFILKIGDFLFEPESPSFYSSWKTKEEAANIANRIVELLVDLMEKEKKPFSEEELLERGTKEILRHLHLKIPIHYLVSYVEATKKIEKNQFGKYGPAWWPEISPRGMSDCAYLILKNEKRPLHFCEIAKKIEKFFQRPIHVNSLHNELIKSDRFVLVGRGTYGLKEWGYKDGTVKDIIEDILNERGPLTKNEILNEVQKQRLVKENTILLNLQYFQKTREGKYKI